MLPLTEQGRGGQLAGWQASGIFLPGHLGPHALLLYWPHATEGAAACQLVRSHSTFSQLIWGTYEILMLGLYPRQASFRSQRGNPGLSIF